MGTLPAPVGTSPIPPTTVVGTTPVPPDTAVGTTPAPPSVFGTSLAPGQATSTQITTSRIVVTPPKYGAPPKP